LGSDVSVFYCVILFAFYSFWGWVVEVIYRSVTQRRFVNAGFLFGPFVPLYGFGAAAVVVLECFFSGWHIILRFIILGVALTVLEYLVGFFAEKIFKLKLWDYSENKLNLHGRVCLHFSVIWAVFAMIFIMFIHPATLDKVKLLDGIYIKAAAVLFLVYFVVDYTVSLISLVDFRRKATYLYVEYLNLSNREIEKILYSFQRLRSAFPALNKYIDNSINNSIKE